MERTATEADYIIYVTYYDLVLESNQDLVHEVAEVGPCFALSIRNTLPPEQAERGDECEVVSILGFDEHAEVATTDVEGRDILLVA